MYLKNVNYLGGSLKEWIEIVSCEMHLQVKGISVEDYQLSFQMDEIELKYVVFFLITYLTDLHYVLSNVLFLAYLGYLKITP